MNPQTVTSRWLIVPVIAAGFLTSCDHKDPGLAEKLSLLEAELRDRDEQLSKMQEEQAKVSGEEAKPASSGPDIDAAKTAYSSFIENVRTKLSGELPDAKFDRTSVFPVEGPDPGKPIASRVAFRIIGKNGRSGEMIIPIYADASGSWLEPEIGESVSKFKAQLDAPAPSVAANNPPAPKPAPAEPVKPKPNDVMGANRTVEVQWNDAPKQGAPQSPPQQQAPAPPQQQQQAPAPQPAAQAMPKKVMPTQRDVIIDFD